MQIFQITELVPGPMVGQMGRISVQWSILELRVEEAIWLLQGIDRKQGRLLTAKENLDPRLKRLKKLAAEKLEGNQLIDMQNIIKDIKIVGKQRNWALHGLYGINKNGEFHAISYRDDFTGKAIKVDFQSLRTVKINIVSVRRRLEKVLPPR